MLAIQVFFPVFTGATLPIIWTPAGSTSKQLPFDQLEGCLIGFAKDGQIVYPWG